MVLSIRERPFIEAAKRRPEGRWILESAPTGRMQANLETAGKPSKWITLYALKVLKRLHKLDNEELMEK